MIKVQEASKEKQYDLLINTDIKKLIVKLAIPTSIIMLVTSLYSIVDTYFVSQLGKSASAAVGLVFPLQAIMQAIGFTIGMGSGNRLSIFLGKKDNKKADEISSSALLVSFISGLLLTISGLIFIDSFSNLLGASETTFDFVKIYLFYMLIGAPFVISSFVMNNILRFVGKAAYSMVGLVSGAVLNIFLDWLFIAVFEMGVMGAAVATLISQIVSFILLSSAFIFKRSVVNINLKFFSHNIKGYWEVFLIGLPSLCRQGFASLSVVFLNYQAAEFGGDAAISAMNIVSKIFNLVFCMALGIGQGFQPVSAFNYGAMQYKRAKEAVIFTFRLCTAVLIVLALICFIGSDFIVSRFIDDKEVIEIGVKALKIQAITFPFLSVNLMCNMAFQSTGHKTKAILLASLRQGFVFIPCVIILPLIMKLTGVIITQPASDMITSIISLPFLISFINELNKKISEG